MFDLFRKKTKFEKAFRKSYLGKYNKVIEKGYENDNICLYLIKSKSNNNRFVLKIKNYVGQFEYLVHEILYNKYHENIQRVYHFKEEKGLYFIAYEYIDGCNLYEYFTSNHYIKEYDIKNIIKQIVAGLKFLHSNHIIHGDLKMENIIINSLTKKIKIIDFDLSIVSKNTQRYKYDSAFGTIEYIAPESAYLHVYSNKSDIWQLGVMLYTLAVSMFPYGKDLKDMYNINFEVLNSNLPLKSLLQQMLKYNENERCDLKYIEESKWLNS